MSAESPRYEPIPIPRKPLPRKSPVSDTTVITEQEYSKQSDDAENPVNSKDTWTSPLMPWTKSRDKSDALGSIANGKLSEHSSIWSRGWVWELSSFALALVCFIAAVVMLAVLKNKPVRIWSSSFSINAILSVLVSIMKGAIGITVAECLSQLKWSWFKQQRKLDDLAVIDNSSRGIWGALVLLGTKRSWMLVYLGAFIFPAMFVVGPTLQSTVGIQLRDIDAPGQSATLSICNTTYLKTVGISTGPGLRRATLPIIGAIYTGLLQTEPHKKVNPSCQSGNCTFPTYQTLAVCNECVDLSDKLRYTATNTINSSISLSECQKESSSCTVELPGYGVRLSKIGVVNATIDYAAEDTAHRFNFSTDPSIGIFRGILRQNGEMTESESLPPTFSAVQCNLRLCVNTYASLVRKGEYEEQLISSTWVGSKTDDGGIFSFQNNVTLTANPCYIDGEEKSPPFSVEDASRCNYRIAGGDAFALANTLSPMLSGYAESISIGGRMSWSTDTMAAIWGMFNETDWRSPETGNFKTVDRALTSLASSLTTHMRSSQAVCRGAFIRGTTTTSELYVSVTWARLTPTVVVLALASIFLTTTIVRSRNDQLWKSSVYAYLFKTPRLAGEELTPREMIRFVDVGSEADLPKDVSNVIKRCERLKVSFHPKSSVVE